MGTENEPEVRLKVTPEDGPDSGSDNGFSPACNIMGEDSIVHRNGLLFAVQGHTREASAPVYARL